LLKSLFSTGGKSQPSLDLAADGSKNSLPLLFGVCSFREKFAPDDFDLIQDLLNLPLLEYYDERTDLEHPILKVESLFQIPLA